jgi:alpha-galactosidase
MDYPNDDHYLYGVVGKNESLFIFAALRPTTTSHSPNLRLRGLDRSKNYQVAAVFPAGIPGMMLISPPGWLTEGVMTTGAILEEIGLPAPILQPAQALIIEIKAI